VDRVKREISSAAVQALDFLKAREEFWNQLQLGTVANPMDSKSKTQSSKKRNSCS